MTGEVGSAPSVRIIHLDPATLEHLADGDLVLASQHCPWQLSPWLAGPDAVDVWRVRARQAVAAPQDLPWITGIVWDEHAAAAVGMAGFHAAPDAEGMVEVGYAVDPALRRRGDARAALDVLLSRAHASPLIRTVRATVAPDNLPSLALLADYDFLEVGEQWDEEDGLEIVYELAADASRSRA
ncbi:GNAT family N-acetyltransferase [Nocardioides pelophilus]|uniref:GNAT family N-acetyltransferase n=1 Tax=Nocardioides pelophilus TaxID=2172019 RepID=UPI00160462C2|nr:GNAT family N-acetyltransferase [Nocardioides pelophilus]